MEIFYNRMEPNYNQVVEMGPKWWTEYLEMDANYRFAGWTLDLMAFWLEQIVRNQFPEHCDETTLRMYEKILRIEVDSDATIEDRRAEVMAYFYGTQKICMSTIQEIVMAYTGKASTIYWDKTKLMVYVLSTEDSEYRSQKLSNYLRKRIPAHLDYALKFYVSYENEAQMATGAAVAGIEIIANSEIMSDISIAVQKVGFRVSGTEIVDGV